ncbi:MAG: FAD-dependent oxidoreductase [Ignisphaera sp.]|nr:FAD-dependent oxidoreductase [Ignisphaera sp.]MCX8168294.1 FAD-dependent oxidoreductase [Ignisphaera sp.]MDW8085886.1 FAD-dependent oxidoreductase [Ignisphaera sp.]
MKFAFMCREPGGKRGSIAIIGSGAAGLAAAGYLACQGYEVNIYEKLPYAGGAMMFAIPTYKIPPDSVIEGVEDLRDRFSVKFFFKTKVFRSGQNRGDLGDDFVDRVESLERVVEEHDAVLIATGAWHPTTVVRNVRNVATVFEYLYLWRLRDEGLSPNLIPKGRKVVIIGADLPVFEAARRMLDYGSEEIYILYSSNVRETPTSLHWMQHLSREGVKFIQYTDIKRIIVEHDTAKALEYTEFDYKKSQYITRVIDANLIMVSLGSRSTPPALESSTDIGIDDTGKIIIDGQYRTKLEKVYASGSVVLGLIYRLGTSFRDGMNAAKYIDIHLSRKRFL